MKILSFNKSILFLFLTINLGLLSISAAQDKGLIEDATLHVVSDKMIAQRETSIVEFIGNVKATRLDAVILADSIKVYFSESDSSINEKKPDSPQSNVKKIIATGNVEYTSKERKAYADQAVYTAENEMLVLTGKNPKLVTGKNYVTGKKITLFRTEEKVIVESDGTNRVEAMFIPEQN